MRIKAPIPLGLPRLTPPGGLLIDGTHIPGDVVVSVPTHAIQLDPRYFEDPEEFRPERWEDISSVDDVPFLPFSRGQWTFSLFFFGGGGGNTGMGLFFCTSCLYSLPVMLFLSPPHL